MPSSNGVYSLPSGYLAVTGTTIQASQHNPPLEDIAAALTGRLSRDGTAAMIGALQLAVGAVGLPGAVFSTDPTSGFYKTTNGIGVAIAGAKVAEFVAGGIQGARLIGELIPFTGLNTPLLTVVPVGQTLSRTAFPDLWQFAQNQIANGNNFFYNNGDGSTTFGIGDLRGRVLATPDAGAGRISTSVFNATSIGGIGGSESIALALSQLPTGIQSTGTFAVSNPFVSNPNGGITLFSANAGAQVWQAWGAGATVVNIANPTASGNVTSFNTSGQSHPNVQPSMVVSHLLFAGA